MQKLKDATGYNTPPLDEVYQHLVSRGVKVVPYNTLEKVYDSG